jgi:NADH-quinone oxidoreductase subunit J
VGGALFAGLLLFAQILEPTGGPAARGSATQGDVVNVERLATSLFTDFLWPFEITSALLVIAVVGGVVLARRGSAQPEEHDLPIGADAGSDEGPAALLEPEE